MLACIHAHPVIEMHIATGGSGFITPDLAVHDSATTMAHLNIPTLSYNVHHGGWASDRRHWLCYNLLALWMVNHCWLLTMKLIAINHGYLVGKRSTLNSSVWFFSCENHRYLGWIDPAPVSQCLLMAKWPAMKVPVTYLTTWRPVGEVLSPAWYQCTF